MTSFTALSAGNNIVLNWTTATETNNLGFEIQRKMGNDFVTIGYVKGNGTTTQIQDYSYTDRELANGSYAYRLKQIDFNGSYEFSNTIEVNVEGPRVYSLEQNYPNPFNPATIIKYNIKEAGYVSLKVLNLIGEQVVSLVNEIKQPGEYDINFDGVNLPSGIYFYRLDAGDFSSTKKLILLK